MSGYHVVGNALGGFYVSRCMYMVTTMVRCGGTGIHQISLSRPHTIHHSWCLVSSGHHSAPSTVKNPLWSRSGWTPTELMSGFTLVTNLIYSRPGSDFTLVIYPLNYSSGPEVQSEPTTTTFGEPQAIDGWWTWNFSIGFYFYSQTQQSAWLLVFTTYLITTH